ncbi:hypothetical protein [Pseudomonas nabeulensis]|nr:hypothetical protein [Pseudomonas nabeulensis]
MANAPAATLESEKVCASASMEGHRSVAEMAYWQAKKGATIPMQEGGV